MSLGCGSGRMGTEDEIEYVIINVYLRESNDFIIPGNQFRSLEEDEVVFLDSVRERQMQEERERKKREGEELKQFRE